MCNHLTTLELIFFNLSWCPEKYRPFPFMNTYSEMCTNIVSRLSSLIIKPCPLFLQNSFTFPVNVSLFKALSELKINKWTTDLMNILRIYKDNENQYRWEKKNLFLSVISDTVIMIPVLPRCEHCGASKMFIFIKANLCQGHVLDLLVSRVM